jgi:hypothetical protein
MKLRRTGEENFLIAKYQSMINRLKYNPSYQHIKSEYENQADFVNYWLGKVDWQSRPELDRKCRWKNYSKSNCQFLSKEEHKLKSAKERALLTDEQAKEVILSDLSTWKLADELPVSQNTIHRLKAGLSYSWIMRPEEEEQENERRLVGLN